MTTKTPYRARRKFLEPEAFTLLAPTLGPHMRSTLWPIRSPALQHPLANDSAMPTSPPHRFEAGAKSEILLMHVGRVGGVAGLTHPASFFSVANSAGVTSQDSMCLVLLSSVQNVLARQ